MKGYHVTLTATEQGFVLDDGKGSPRQMPKEMGLDLLVAITRLEAALVAGRRDDREKST